MGCSAFEDAPRQATPKGCHSGGTALALPMHFPPHCSIPDSPRIPHFSCQQEKQEGSQGFFGGMWGKDAAGNSRAWLDPALPHLTQPYLPPAWSCAMGRSSAWTRTGSSSTSGRRGQPAPPCEAAFPINSIYLHPIVISMFLLWSRLCSLPCWHPLHTTVHCSTSLIKHLMQICCWSETG